LIRNTAIRKKRSGAGVTEKRLRLLVDTNIVLDVILAQPMDAGRGSTAPWRKSNARPEKGCRGHGITTVYDIVAKAKGREVGTMATSNLLQLLTAVPTDAGDFQRALSMSPSATLKMLCKLPVRSKSAPTS
jgi:hypothetical protein